MKILLLLLSLNVNAQKRSNPYKVRLPYTFFRQPRITPILRRDMFILNNPSNVRLQNQLFKH